MKLRMWGVIALFIVALLATVATNLAVYHRQETFLQEWFTILLIIDGILVLSLFAVVVGMVTRMIVSWRRGEPGARLSLRLTFLLWGMSLLPAIVLYSVSIGAVFRGIEQWFDTPLGQSFERGIAFGQDIISGEFNRLEYVARDIGRDLRSYRGSTSFYFDDARLFYSLDSIALYDRSGQLLIESGNSDAETISAALANRIITDGLYLNLHGDGLNRIVQVALPLRQGGRTAVLLVTRALPIDVAEGLMTIERGEVEYQRLQVLRTGLRWSFILTMSLAMFLILFAAGWISLRLGSNLTRPLVQLSTAAEAVGKGHLKHKLRATHPIKEITQLNLSFNKMVDDLERSQRQAAERQTKLHTSNAYLENLLSSLTAGVLTFTAEGALSICNPAAAAYLGRSVADLRAAGRLPASDMAGEVRQAMAELADSADSAIEHRVVLPDERVLLLRALPLSAAAGGGTLVVIDDISRQMQAEREATWEEASRRFVHEIKNPLTPIQLAAERLRDKLGIKLTGEDGEILARLVRTIVNQVSAMRQMVDSFRDYADKRRAPPAHPVQLNDLVREVLTFYESRGILIQTDLQADLPPIQGNEVTLRQLLLNVLGNAMDALEDKPQGMIKVRSALAGQQVQLCIEDNGGGVPAEMLKKLCEPYVTTKPQGTGLGLAVVRKTVDEHGGRLEIENGSDGLRVTIQFIVAGSGANAAPPLSD